MKIYHLLPLFFLLSTTGCAPTAVVKSDVNASSKSARESVVELRDKDKVDVSDVTKLADAKKSLEENRNNVIEIKGTEPGLKFTDSKWKDFPITLDLNAVPLHVYFEMLNKLTSINFVLGEEVKGDISINIKDVNWIESLEIVLKNKNLISDVDQSGIVVSIHTHDFIASQSESLQKALSSKMIAQKSYANLESKSTAIIRLYYTKPDILAQQLKDVIQTLDAGGTQASASKNLRASFVIDARTNSIIIQATPSDMEWIKTAINSLDRPTSQVLVEVFIVEATDNFEQQLGSRIALFNYGSTTGLYKGLSGTVGGGVTSASQITLASSAGYIANTVPKSFTALGGVAATLGGGNNALKVELQAMQQESLIKIVSNPKLFIIDNEQATITDGTEVPYTTASASGGQLATPVTQFKVAALQLQVKPTVIGDGNIYLDLTVNKDSVASTGSPPAITKKELKTKLLVKDGGIAMIGGINKSEATTTEDGVPGLAKLPIIGNFFKSKGDSNRRNQLYIFLAPKVL
jgi:type IV pilus assembly protein PilQ